MISPQRLRAGCYILVFLLSISGIQAQRVNNETDTLKISLPDADRIFLEKNLALMAAQYDLSIAEAGIIQARLYENPSVYFEQNIYNSNNKKYFDAGYSGENILQVQQLVHLAGQRNKRVALQKINREIAGYQFYDLLRTLKFQLRSAFYETYFDVHALHTYDYQINTLQALLDALQRQYQKGNISLKEVIRIRATVFGLQSERNGLVKELTGLQTELRLLLGVKPDAFVMPALTETQYDSLDVRRYGLRQLIDSAYNNRSDLKAAQGNVRFNEADIRYQRSLAFPDVRFGYMYDKQGNFIRDYNAVSIALDLPVFNRNRGNILAAKARTEQSRKFNDIITQQLENEVRAGYLKAIANDSLYKSFDKDFSGSFEKVMQSMVENYQKRNIGVVEFLDYYETYKNTSVQFYQLSGDRLNAFEELNFVTGRSLFIY
jgi:cobalt-zinc-cadmium efflux system outer membrane protein